jgi:uncharacterized membrane protein YvlD (DUF360 family)
MATQAATGPWYRRRRWPVLRVVVVTIVTAAAIALSGAIFSGVEVQDFGSALAAALLIGIVNALLWPLAMRLLLPITVLTLGLAALVLNGAVVLAVASLDRGFVVDSLGDGILVAFVLTVVNTITTSLLTIDDDEPYYRNVVRRRARRSEGAVESDVPGLLFLEIDGLAHEVVRRAIRDGNVPTLAAWLHDGTHHLTRWETDWSSQTGACQAGLLHGDNDDMPAFRWWEKDRDAPMVTNKPRDAMELERRHSDGHGLLYADGASRANILSGDAPHSLLTMSTVLDRDRPGRVGQDYFAYFASPYNVMRTLALVIREIAAERRSAGQQVRFDVRPRIHRSFVYSVMRAWATVIQLDLQVQAVISDIYAGRPVTYTTFLAYDEVAHHSGIERPETLITLRRVDRQIRRIAAAVEGAPRPYRLVVLSDHGQSQGETFLDRYGESLESVVRAATDSDEVAAPDAHPDEALGYLGAGLTEAADTTSTRGRALHGLTRGRTGDDGAVDLGHPDGDQPAGDDRPPEIVVMASGCLGLVSFPREPGRMTLERFEACHPRLLPALRRHPGVGFVLVRSEAHGALAIGPDGTNHLDEGWVDGEDPLAAFGPHAAEKVRRTDGFPHCPDIVVNSSYWAEGDEVAAFEELVGSHGGMGGPQSYPFVLHPVELEMPAEELLGAEAVHRVFRRWLAALGQDAYAEPVHAPPV